MSMITVESGHAVAPGRTSELQQLDSLQHLPISEIKLLAEQGVLRAFEPQSIIAAQYSVARHLYLVISGTIQQFVLDQDDTEITLALLGRGDILGEGGLFGARHRRATIRATTRSFVLQFKYTDLETQAERLPQFFSVLRIRFRERLLQTTLARVPLLASLTPLERLSIAQQLDDRRVDRGTDIIQAGGISEALYIIAEGQAKVVHNGQTLAVIEPGHLCGEMSLLDGSPHEATITALTPVHLLLLPRPTFEYLMTQRRDVTEGLHQLAAERKQTDRTPEHIVVTEQLVNTGIVRGEMALMRETQRCAPDCHRCRDACSERFEVPRLDFSGTMVSGLEAADTCRHCEWGAECAESCPEDAFRLDRDGHLVITDRCTGCGACVTACPYDAINQVPVYAPTSNPLRWLLRQVRRQAPTMLRANKCDACAGYEDYACVNACPTGALQWVPVESLYARKPLHMSPNRPATRS